MNHERRQATRFVTSDPVTVEVIGQREQPIHPALEKVYERVVPAPDRIGETITCQVRDLSTNGAFLTGEPLPLLSRVRFELEIEGYGKAPVIAWTLWRRKEPCEIPRGGEPSVSLAAGFGVLFESIPLRAREAIADLAASRGSV